MISQFFTPISEERKQKIKVGPIRTLLSPNNLFVTFLPKKVTKNSDRRNSVRLVPRLHSNSRQSIYGIFI